MLGKCCRALLLLACYLRHAVQSADSAAFIFIWDVCWAPTESQPTNYCQHPVTVYLFRSTSTMHVCFCFEVGFCSTWTTEQEGEHQAAPIQHTTPDQGLSSDPTLIWCLGLGPKDSAIYHCFMAGLSGGHTTQVHLCQVRACKPACSQFNGCGTSKANCEATRGHWHWHISA